MFKIYWLLKRAEGLSVEDFSDWWLNHHAPYIAARQGRFLARYSVNLALPDEGSLPAGTGVESDWDGLAEEIFQMPVRLGYPIGITGLREYVQDPAYASVVGLLIYGKDMRTQQKKAVAARESVGGMVKRLTSWFKGEF